MPGSASSSCDEGQDQFLSMEERKQMVNKIFQDETKAFLPKAVRRRISALKKIQAEFVRRESNFFKEAHDLECKYDKLASQYMERRRQIICGESEPTEEESTGDYPERDIFGWRIDPKIFEKVDVKGIPFFWITVLHSIPMLNEIITISDDMILTHLVDIRSAIHNNPMSFKLEFEFSKNEYFTNKILSKEYFLRCEPKEDSPFEIEGCEIFKCSGTKIDWKGDKNVTVKWVKDKKSRGSQGDVATKKLIQIKSFFNFFNIPKDQEENESIEHGLVHDYELATYLRERVIPRAILYFTGEAFVDDESEFSELEKMFDFQQKSDEEQDKDYESGSQETNEM